MTEPFRTLDLFAGIGGWHLGLEATGAFRVVASVENEPKKREVHRRVWPHVPVFRDIRKVTGDAVRRSVGDIGFICGSPPCQDASAANARGRGIDGPETGLFREAVRLVRELRPAWACFENSPRLRTRGYDRVRAWLEEADYAVWPFVVGAEDLGAPHERKRVWIVARALDARTQHRELVGTSAVQDTDADSFARRRGAGRRHRPQAGDGDPQCCPDAARLGWPTEGRWRRQDGVLRCDGAPADDGHAPSEQVGRAGLAWQDDIAVLGRSECAWLVEHPWAGGLVQHLRMADGLSAGLPARELARMRSFYGDAILPAIATCIGRAIVRADGVSA
jgi:site-specific DNA-cytosine methylase